MFGGCIIGVCFVDMYIIGLEKMGVIIELDEGYVKVILNGCLYGV